MKKGIDISHHQGNVDFNKVKSAGVDFIILRDGYRNTTDRKFFEYVKKAKEVGLAIFGVYHFSYALNEKEAKKEARFCIENMKKAGLGKDVMVFYDFEYDTVRNAIKKGVTLAPKDCNDHTVAFCEEVKNLGFIPGVYMNLDYHKNWYSNKVLNDYPLWLADYSGKPDFECLIQQYTSKGKIPGINGKVDLNYYYGEDFKIKDQETSKDIDTIAREVIFGLWGNGDKRKQSLENAGFKYREIQDRVNEILNGPAENPIPSPEKSNVIDASCYAKSMDPSLAGAYTTTANLYCRAGAGTNKIALCCIPKDTKVNNYGFYTNFNGVKWLLIQFTLNGIKYAGFSSSKYLKRD